MNEFQFKHGNNSMELFQKAFNSIAPLNKKESSVTELNRFVLVQLFASLYSTSESMISLVRDGKLHDAEILLRTIIEGTIKYLYMASGELEVDNKEIGEFYLILPKIQNMRNNNKMKTVILQYQQMTGKNHPFLEAIISEEEIARLNTEYPRKVREEIERKWSFNNILRELIEKNEGYKELCGLFYAYSLSSHYIHQDGNSLSIQFESMKTISKGEERFELAFAARLLSNVITMFLLRYQSFMNIHQIIKNDCFLVLKELLDYSIELGIINEELLEKRL